MGSPAASKRSFEWSRGFSRVQRAAFADGKILAGSEAENRDVPEPSGRCSVGTACKRQRAVLDDRQSGRDDRRHVADLTECVDCDYRIALVPLGMQVPGGHAEGILVDVNEANGHARAKYGLEDNWAAVQRHCDTGASRQLKRLQGHLDAAPGRPYGDAVADSGQ